MKKIEISFGPLQWVYSAFLSMLILGASCTGNSSNAHDQQINSGTGDTAIELPEDFLTFYKRFHEDSIFQMEHIDFPLKGLPDGADPEEKGYEDYYYTRDQWIIHKSFDPKLYSTKMIMLSDIIFEERITERKYELMIIRRFAKGSGGWRLIYYAGLNKWTEKQNNKI